MLLSISLAWLARVYGNGDEFDSRQGSQIALSKRRVVEPNPEFLGWHLSEVFKA